MGLVTAGVPQTISPLIAQVWEASIKVRKLGALQKERLRKATFLEILWGFDSLRCTCSLGIPVRNLQLEVNELGPL